MSNLARTSLRVVARSIIFGLICFVASALSPVTSGIAQSTVPTLSGSCSSEAIPSSATVYYVSPTGSDSNPGTSPCSPWQTTARAARQALQPGETIAFKGGASFSGSFSPWAEDQSGTPTSPITYTSYGSGQASLTNGIYLASASYLDITDLNISSATSRGIGTSAAGSGVTNVTVSDSEITSSYDAGEGGYGIGLMNHADSSWTIKNDTIDDTADSGILSVGPDITVESSTFADDGVGSHCGDDPATGWASTTYNPCHAIYAKSAGWTIRGNTITNSDATTAPATFSAITLRGQDNTVANNNISGPGSGNGISFWSETTTPGTTYITDNTISGELDTGIQTGAGTEPIVESFVIDGNVVEDAGNYAAFFYPALGTASLMLTGNTFTAAPGASYLNLANPPATPPPGLASNATTSYTVATYSDSDNRFLGATTLRPWAAFGRALTWAEYSALFGPGSVGQGDLAEAPELLVAGSTATDTITTTGTKTTSRGQTNKAVCPKPRPTRKSATRGKRNAHGAARSCTARKPTKKTAHPKKRPTPRRTTSTAHSRGR